MASTIGEHRFLMSQLWNAIAEKRKIASELRHAKAEKHVSIWRPAGRILPGEAVSSVEGRPESDLAVTA